MRTSIVIATVGRPHLVERTLDWLLRQDTGNREIILSCALDSPVPPGRPGMRVVTGSKGLTKQRNVGLSAVAPEAEFVCFFDDDFLPAADWLREAEALFDRWDDVVGVSGRVLADGIKGPGISFEDGCAIVAAAEAGGSAGSRLTPMLCPYGCNMIFRRAALHRLRFDERLPLYGWQEDRDFGALVSERGRLVRADALRGVHLGWKEGRTSGIRLGYSQIVNPAYLMRKGTMRWTAALDHAIRNVAANAARSLNSEPFIDRRGRLKGNVFGLLDLIRGKASPERANDL